MKKLKMVKTFGRSGNLEDRLQVNKFDKHGLHSAIRKTLMTGRILGLLPVSGLGHSYSHKLRFSLSSSYGLFYFASLLGQFLMCLMSLYWLTHNKVTFTNVSNTLFYSLSLISILALANVGRSWPKLLSKVEEIERTLPPFKRSVPFFCNLTMALILISAIIEHFLSVLYGYTVAKSCHSTNVAETFFHYDKPWIFNYVTYNLWTAVLMEILNMQATFTWTYNDILIMVISIYLAEHFVMHNQLLKKAVKQEGFSCREFRTQYLQIVRLVKLINNHIGIYILICFGSNLYWICTQLFYTLNKNQTGHFVTCTSRNSEAPEYKAVHGIEHTIYFSYSLFFLVTRTFLVLMLAARVNTTSIVPLSMLYEIPTDKFNVEIQRYISQINNIKVALTGLDFFYVTRTMILTLLRTIVTYELVLLQFNK